ncbi:hypothetical protein GI584_00165 [Gracilibacillus salitolerans]|uniref:Uncharacterized protein n=1 Tax=Gracilibacillus salitolerans TaxID=2663022 RepID=A0A5Q2TF30_9BACI|nr:hypothetical protein [Gracilibacillus salitolerans]QGH32593.1 hypothetical protein GI584_00165 [Gracilibacillus salitolerans]
MFYSITFWTNENMMEFWSNVRMLLETIQPGIMLTVAIVLVGALIGVIVRSFKKTEDDENNDRDYEIRRY